MICALCSKVALYRVKDRGYCRGHYAVAHAQATTASFAASAMSAAKYGHADNKPRSGRNHAIKGLRLSSKGGYGRAPQR